MSTIFKNIKSKILALDEFPLLTRDVETYKMGHYVITTEGDTRVSFTIITPFQQPNNVYLIIKNREDIMSKHFNSYCCYGDTIIKGTHDRPQGLIVCPRFDESNITYMDLK